MLHMIVIHIGYGTGESKLMSCIRLLRLERYQSSNSTEILQ
jgi:hypothetical protein